MASVNFFCEDVEFSLPTRKRTADWINNVVRKEEQTLKQLNYIFCSDEHLLEINRKFLNHDTLTDIITFNHSEKAGYIEGDIFISLDRVFDNALFLKRPFLEELHRVIIHGALHLLGYNDKTAHEKVKMREKEDGYLSLPIVPRETFF